LCFIFTNLFSGHHTLFNLEPYPDGLWYLGEARSIAQGKGLVLSYHAYTIDGRVPPVYPLVLTTGFLLIHNPEVYYGVNVVLGVLTIFLLFLILRRWTTRQWTVFFCLLFYLTHGYILWMVGVPMAENVAVPVFCFGLWILLAPKLRLIHLVFMMAAIATLLFTKYAYIGTATVFGLITFLRLVKTGEKKAVLVLVGLASLGAMGMAIWFWSHQTNPFELFSPQHFGGTGASGIFYYSIQYVSRNAQFYLSSFAGLPSQFL